MPPTPDPADRPTLVSLLRATLGPSSTVQPCTYVQPLTERFAPCESTATHIVGRDRAPRSDRYIVCPRHAAAIAKRYPGEGKPERIGGAS